MRAELISRPAVVRAGRLAGRLVSGAQARSRMLRLVATARRIVVHLPQGLRLTHPFPVHLADPVGAPETDVWLVLGGGRAAVGG